MIYRKVSLPIFIRIDKGILENLADIIKEENLFFKKVAILTGNYGEKIVFKKKLDRQFLKTVIFNVKKNTSVSQIRSFIINNKIELLLTIGGGSVNDIGKYISMETSIPHISIPTVLSNDGIASPISILRVNAQYKSIGTTPPIGIIADLHILSKAPKILLLSGVGDLISNVSANLDWQLAYKDVGEKIDFFAKKIAHDSALNFLYNSLNKKYDSLYSEKFLKNLFDGLVMSGIAMVIAKSSRPASGAEHNISHALDKLGIGKLHGLQVGFATLFTLFLHKANDVLEDIIKFYKHLGFPMSFKDLGICETNFIKALILKFSGF
jgi:glycerol-1-phosphate dehydrogenase [NAD(P)+]